MTVSAVRVAITTTAAKVVDKASTVRGKSHALVKNTGANTVFLGGAGVTSATGFALVAGASFETDFDNNDVLWGLTASSTSELSVLAVR